MNQFKARLLGAGAEGKVYQIAPNLVKKVWYDVPYWVDGKRHADIILKKRLANVKRKVQRLPAKIRAQVKIPLWAGYECTKDNKFISYHEFVSKSKLKCSGLKWDAILNGLYKVDIIDAYMYNNNGNVIYSKDGKFYLVDVG